MAASLASMIGLASAALAISAAVTCAAIAYAHRRRLIDVPGRRRSHDQPTPRGGGIGIVVAVLVCLGVPLLFDGTHRLAIPLAFALVAAIGWVDDHRPLSARLRLSVHALAAVLVYATAMRVGGVDVDAGVVLGACVIVFALVASINLHNFMDGINGLLALQAIYVGLVFSALAQAAGDTQTATAALVLTGASAGFLPFNFPRARIFMGDVGSGGLGFAIGLLGIAVAGHGVMMMACVAVAGSAFVIDAGATLSSRMLHGRRWYSAHREHLYQWLVRSGCRHAQVSGLYLAWNLCVATPVIGIVASGRVGQASALVMTGAVYAVGLGLWVFGKRHCLREIRQQHREQRA